MKPGTGNDDREEVMKVFGFRVHESSKIMGADPWGDGSDENVKKKRRKE